MNQRRRKAEVIFHCKKGSERMEEKEIKKNKGRKQMPVKIRVEHVYLGGQSMEEVFEKISENNIKENLTDYKKAM